MNRRAFLAWLCGTVAGVAAAPYLDLEKLLWVPGAKHIVIPEPIAKWPLSLIEGDIFTIAGVFAKNPQTNLYTSALQHFIITADVTANAKMQPDLEIWPRVNLPKEPKIQTLGWLCPMD